MAQLVTSLTHASANEQLPASQYRTGSRKAPRSNSTPPHPQAKLYWGIVGWLLVEMCEQGLAQRPGQSTGP